MRRILATLALGLSFIATPALAWPDRPVSFGHPGNGTS